MALRRDIIEPTVRKMCHLIVQSGAPISHVWAGYTQDEDLLPLRTESDSYQHFRRATNQQARVEAYNMDVLPVQAAKLKIYPETVMGSTPKSAFMGEIDNRGNKFESQPLGIHMGFKNAEAERQAIEAGWETETILEAKAQAGLEGVAEAEVKETVRNRLYGSIKSQSESSSEQSIQTDWSIIAPPFTHMKGFLTWDEQDITRHTENHSSMGFGITIGRRWRKKGKGWRWYSGHHTWSSQDHFIATLMANGAAGWSLYEYFGSNPILPHHPLWPILQEVIEGPRQVIHKYVTYKGAAHVKAVPEVLAYDGPEDEDENEDKED